LNDCWPLCYLVYDLFFVLCSSSLVIVSFRLLFSSSIPLLSCKRFLLQLSRSLSQFERKDIKTQSQFNHILFCVSCVLLFFFCIRCWFLVFIVSFIVSAGLYIVYSLFYSYRVNFLCVTINFIGINLSFTLRDTQRT